MPELLMTNFECNEFLFNFFSFNRMTIQVLPIYNLKKEFIINLSLYHCRVSQVL